MPSTSASTPEDDRIALAAYKLAVHFTEYTDMPARYRRLADPSRKVRKVKEDSEIERRFKANVESWRQLIDTMLAKIDEVQAWRFINLSPQFDTASNRVTANKDFCDFMDYLIMRRDKDQCAPDELGSLALLSVAFQREVEKRIQS